MADTEEWKKAYNETESEGKELIWEDKKKIFKPKPVIIGIAISLIMFVVFITTQIEYSSTLLIVLGGTVLFILAMYIFRWYTGIITLSKKIKVYSNGITVKTSDSSVRRFSQMGLEDYFFPFSEIEKMEISPIIGMGVWGPASGAQSLLLQTNDGKKHASTLVDKKGFLEALERVNFNRIQVNRFPRPVNP